MKFQTEVSDKESMSKKNQKIQNDIDLLVKHLPMLNDCFQLHTKVGKGTFSNVYLATLKNSNSTQKYAVKHLTQTCEQSRIQSELRCLQEIGGKDNVVPAELCLSDGNDCVTFIMPYLPHLRFADYVGKMDVEETRLYMKNLFIALRRVHSFNIIHRDVKPDNFLYNRETKEFLLVDFGLAQAVRTPNQGPASSTPVTNENIPLDYSKKRKRPSESSDDESKSPAKATKRIALKSKDNNIKIWQTPKVHSENKTENEKKGLCLSNRGTEVTKTSRINKLSPDKSSLKPRTANGLSASPSTRKILVESCEMKSPGSAHSVFKSETGTKTTDENANGKFLGNGCVTPLGATKTRNGSPFHSRINRILWKHSPSSVVHFESPGVPKQVPSTSAHLRPCPCSGKGGVCSLCFSRDKMEAPRAGTSGFRAPEVLFRYLYQTTAVDMWASGVVMLCILSGSYPFFNSSSDLVSLAEIMTVFGTERTIKVASKFGRRIVCSEHRKGVDLKKLCARLRARSANKKSDKTTLSTDVKCRDCLQTIRSDGCICPSDDIILRGNKQEECTSNSGVLQFPDSAFDLLRRLLDLDPTSRITAKEALEHPFITGN
ncbi:hypothetical protein RUM44_013315 [Polyplax serrata]|uniref:non-specific serine/threonine protein kinase n=1 Tax=Polyplax serrata TaxID=468196 RepID=A0ABR1BI57_POLSC